MALGIERKKETLAALGRGVEDARARAYFKYLVEQGAVQRWGVDWEAGDAGTVRRERIEHECAVILKASFHSAFIMLADIMDFCRKEAIPYGPGRGSVGGCLVAYCMGIHEIDSIEFGLLFERFLNPQRVSFPDVDIDVSQRHRDRVLEYIRETHTRDGQIVLQVGAFARMTARAVVDTMATAAQSEGDYDAYATATNLKKCFPKGSVSGGVKTERELAYWLGGKGGHGDRDRFREIATQAGWLDRMLDIDGCGTHLAKHAAGVVILREEDLPFMPQTSTDGVHMMTAYDMYALDDLGVLKWDILGLRTLDVISDAHKLLGGSGSTPDLMAIWREHRDDPEPYAMLTEGDMTGLFQVDTDGYRHTIKEFQPSRFDHIVQLNALYRPGALDYKEELPEGTDRRPRNMVEVFIDRHHQREQPTYPDPELAEVLAETHGILLYQEQQMAVARIFAGFSLSQADALRKAIGKKRPVEMAKLMELFDKGAQHKPEAVRRRVKENIEKAARYAWNKSHAVEYGAITWLTMWFHTAPRTHAYFASLINSFQEDREVQSTVVSVARQFADLRPPDINIAEDMFTIDGLDIVFGLNGVRGMGDANRNAILCDRAINGPFQNYTDFCRRLPSVPTNMKRALIACGAFDALDDRMDRIQMLATVPRGKRRWTVTFACGHIMQKQSELQMGDLERCSTCKDTQQVVGVQEIERKRWTVAEHINESAKRMGEGRPAMELPSVLEWEFPTDAQLAAAELEATGYYISNVPLAGVIEALRRLPGGHYGGEIESIRTKLDRNENEMAFLTVIGPDLQKQRMLIFASNWPTLQHRIERGNQYIFRGQLDDDTVKVDQVHALDEVGHFKKVKVTRDGESYTQDFDGNPQTLRDLEAHGYRVRLL